MGTFFKGWRRKVGSVTLVIVCVFAAGWVRSVYIVDNFNVHSTYDGSTLFTSGCGSFLYMYTEGLPSSTPELWHSWVPTPEVPFEPFRHAASERGFCGFRYDYTTFGEGCSLSRAQVPYWSIVIPLTLLSAYLLLSKPRPTKKPEPAPTTGT